MPHQPPARPDLAAIEQKVLEITSKQLGISLEKLSPQDRLLEDIQCDSLDFVELIIGLENAFDIHIPNSDQGGEAFKTVFTRNPFRLKDLAELVYLQWGISQPPARGFFSKPAVHSPLPSNPILPFTQLSGRLALLSSDAPRFDNPALNSIGLKIHRRRSDGMRCLQLPSASVRLGYDGPGAQPDETDLHSVWLDSFLIDAEPISTTAYARFLNSIGPIDDATLGDWFILTPGDKRQAHQMLTRTSEGWRPAPGTENFPMVLVSWFGAHAYARWANFADWQNYKEASPVGFLPTEAQWEYAARGPHPIAYSWGNTPPSLTLLQAGIHNPGQTYPTPADLPMAPVNAFLGMTATGLHHMAGNVWQWCADWYDPAFYRSPNACKNDPVNITPTGVRSERGGSWVGPATLARSSYRRARAPHARGRCLGFRCVSAIPDSK